MSNQPPLPDLGSTLDEDRAALVEYIEELMAAILLRSQ
jgi:hypothetical protein